MSVRHSAQLLTTRRQRLTGLVAVLAVAATTAIVGPALSPVPASAATGTLMTGSDLKTVAASVAQATYPNATTTSVVVRSNVDQILTEAAALASARGLPLVVLNPADDAAAAKTALQARGSTKVVLYGSSVSFDKAFNSQFTFGGPSVEARITDDSAYLRTKAAAALITSSVATPDELVIADPTAPNDVRLSVQYAVTNGKPLIFMTGSEGDAELTSLFQAYPSAVITVIGGATFPSHVLPEDRASTVNTIPMGTPEDLAASTNLVARQPITRGYSPRIVYGAPSDQLGSSALASLMAKSKRGVVLAAGSTSAITTNSSLQSNLAFLGTEASTVTLVGTGLSSAQATAVAAPTLTARTGPAGWRVTDMTITASNFTLSYNAAANATSYKAFSIDGTQIGASTSTSMAITGTPVALVLVSYSSAGAEIARLEVRTNEYLASGDRENVVLAQARNNKQNYLKLLGTLKSPRLITRATVDPFSEAPTPVYKELAITCNLEYTDGNLDTTKQYSYEVVPLTSATNQACDSTAPAVPTNFSAVDNLSTVTLPPTTFPEGVAAATAKTLAVNKTSVTSSRAAMPTLTDSYLLMATGKETAKSATMSTMGGTLAENRSAQAVAALPNILVRYQGFIPEDKVFFPTPGITTGSAAYPRTFFGGDNRSAHVACSYCSFRFQTTTTIPFSTGGAITMYPETGITHQYSCAAFSMNCVLKDQDKANRLEGMSLASQSRTATKAKFNLVVHTTIPLFKSGPAIDGNLNFTIAAGGSTVKGTHDGMPVHEIFFGVANSEYSTVYISQSHSLFCLFPQPISGGRCQIQVNQQM